MRALRFLLLQISYDLGSGLLFRPGLVVAGFALAAILVPPLEARLVPELSAWLAAEPSTAQLVLGTLAGSMMTVVSVVYSILLVALSLASIQFSTRILAGMMRDRVAQLTLGLFVGTFVYALLVLRSVHTDPPYVPGVALTLAVALALVSLAGLVWFIHHIIRSIQANYLVEKIAAETEVVIDDVYPHAVGGGGDPVVPPVPEGAHPVLADRSGYVQLIDTDALAELVRGRGRLFVARGMGSFVPAGIPLVWATFPLDVLAVRAAFDLGPVRTMQRDAEFGIRQIVDIALKAISPAVNDPSTAATCVDHLSRLLVRVAGRAVPPAEVEGVVAPVATHTELVDLAFDQLRQYGRGDMAVVLRLLRALADVASVTTDPGCLARIAVHAALLEEGARAAFRPEDCEELGRRAAAVRRSTDRRPALVNA